MPGLTPTLLVSDQHFPEGPCVDRAGNLYWVNGSGANICMRTPAGDVSEFVNTGAGPNGAAFAANGDLYLSHSLRRRGPARTQ